MSYNKLLFAKFEEDEILFETGRLLYSILNAFVCSGYRIILFDNFQDKDLREYAKRVFSLANLTVIDRIPSNSLDWIYLFDREDKQIGRNPWRQKIQIRFDIFSPYRFTHPIMMPYPLHPTQSTPDELRKLPEYRLRNRTMRVFFSGDTKGYIRNRVRYPKPKMPRTEIIDTIIQDMDGNVMRVDDLSVIDDLSKANPVRKCIIVDTDKVWIEEKKWMNYLSKSDFFLAPPGIVMPMCHNIVEAMAVGSIPITNYPEWFKPNLEHMKNCIVFENKEDLREGVRQALDMKTAQIVKMRIEAIDYYETNLRSDVFINKIESRGDRKLIVLMITERNMARNLKKLNSNSVIIKGTNSSTRLRLFNRLAGKFFLYRFV